MQNDQTFDDASPASGPFPQERRPSSFFARRWVARTMDWSLILILTGPLWVLTVRFYMQEGTAHAALWVAGTLLTQVFIAAGVDVGQHVWAGRTIGKALVSLRVIDRTGGRRRPSVRQAVMRAGLTTLLPGVGWSLVAGGVAGMSSLAMMSGVALVAISAMESVTGWHDRITGTQVVSISVEAGKGWSLVSHVNASARETTTFVRVRESSSEAVGTAEHGNGEKPPCPPT
ncbi:RDD family protein [Actinosynnema sp. CS-041913]|uniref:RDD family protein n=1 Tax=Actinosynnema sp. CS-041913 TaxID=3239917 RepID=UPI003D93EBCC